MSSKIETGHAKNIGNFEDLISFCIGFGPAYNPGNAQLQVTALQAKYATCTAELEAVINAKNAYSDITNQRTQAFKDLLPFSTKLINYLVSFGVHKETIKDARSIVRKVYGIKLSKPKEIPESTTKPPVAGKSNSSSQISDDLSKLQEIPKGTSELPVDDKTISSSHKSFDSMLFNFMQLVDLVNGQPAYTPTEPEFTVAGLQAKVVAMKAFVTGVSDANTHIFNARVARNKGLYDAATGLVSIAMDVKAYIKAIFGASSPEFNKVVKLQFKYKNTF